MTSAIKVEKPDIAQTQSGDWRLQASGVTASAPQTAASHAGPGLVSLLATMAASTRSRSAPASATSMLFTPACRDVTVLTDTTVPAQVGLRLTVTDDRSIIRVGEPLSGWLAGNNRSNARRW